MTHQDKKEAETSIRKYVENGQDGMRYLSDIVELMSQVKLGSGHFMEISEIISATMSFESIKVQLVKFKLPNKTYIDYLVSFV